LITIWEQKATIVATMDVSIPQQLVRVVLEKSRWDAVAKKESGFMHGNLPPKSQQRNSGNVASSTKNRNFSFFSQSMRLPSDETIGAYMGILEDGPRRMCYRSRSGRRHHHLFQP